MPMFGIYNTYKHTDICNLRALLRKPVEKAGCLGSKVQISRSMLYDMLA